MFQKFNTLGKFGGFEAKCYEKHDRLAFAAGQTAPKFRE